VQDGQATPRGLRPTLEGDDGRFEGEDKEILLEELSDLERCLKIGEKKKAQMYSTLLFFAKRALELHQPLWIIK
jgi:hypothetical protein